jgi:hypothetical protein
VISPKYRPLPKIVARLPDRPPVGKFIIGVRVNVKIIPRHYGERPFWRLYKVSLIDGDMCRLVTPDKRFAMNAETNLVKELWELQKRLSDS